MAIKLGNNPKDFKRPVHVIKFGGVKDSITFTFLYRDKRQFAAMLDERLVAERMKQESELAVLKEAEELAKAGGDDAPAMLPPIKVLSNYMDWTRDNAEKVLQIATEWDLADPLNVESLQQLEDEFPGALEEIQSVYQKAIAEVRVKN
jgi:hypothetical protein